MERSNNMNNAMRLASVAFLAVLASSLVAQGQTGYYGYRRYGYSYGYPYGYYGVGPATQYQANAYGLSSLIRASGEYEMAHAQAVAQMQATDRKASLERQAQRKAYFEMIHNRAIEMGKENRERLDARREEYLARQKSDQYPDSLPNSELNRETGQIEWTALLGRPVFDKAREEVETQAKLWAQARASKQRFDVADVHIAIDRMRTELKTLIQSVSTSEYLNSRLFLDKLDQTIETPGMPTTS